MRRNVFRLVKAYLWLIPAFSVYIIFDIYPITQAIKLSFFKWDIINPPIFNGIKNYVYALSDNIFLLSLKNTLIFTGVVSILKAVIGLLLAVALAQIIRGRIFYRAVFYLPVTIPLVMVGILWKLMYMPYGGLINGVLEKIGLQVLAQNWLGSIKTALFSIMVTDCWKWIGFNMVIYLAALQEISPDYYDAANIDGANKFQTFRYITIPLLGRATHINILLNMIGGLRVFDLVYVMTEGGPGYATSVMATYIYKTGFSFYRGGYGCALATLLLLLIGTGVVMYIKKTRLIV